MDINMLPSAEDLELLRRRMSTQFQIPSAYDDALSYQGLIYKLIQYLKDTMQNVEDWNNWLEPFVETFDTKLQDNVREMVQELYDNGKLAELVAPVISVVQDQIDVVDSRIDDQIDDVNNKIDDQIGDVNNKIDDVNNYIAEQDIVNKNLINHTKGYKNIYEYEHLKIVDGTEYPDWTSAINTAISEMPNGGTLFFPEGWYKHTGINIDIPYGVEIVGSGRFSTFLLNLTPNQDAITINHSQRGIIRDIGIYGNGYTPYGTTATTGNGIVFTGSNSISWNLVNITVRGHGKNGIYGGHGGHVNNINIRDSDIQFNKEDGIRLLSNIGLINAVYITGNNIDNNGGSGVTMWGHNIWVQNNTVQGNKKYAYNMDANLITVEGYRDAEGMSIIGNYTEKSYGGVMFVRVDKDRFIDHLNIENNFGHEYDFDATVYSAITVTRGTNATNLFENQIKNLTYRNNRLFLKDAKQMLFNGENILSGSCIIEVDKDYTNLVVNVGYGQLKIKQKQVILNNFLEAQASGVTFTQQGKSSSITNPESISYKLPEDLTGGFYSAGVAIDTDYTEPQVMFNFWGKLRCDKGDYVLIEQIVCDTIEYGNIIGTITNKNKFTQYPDKYLEVRVYPNGTGTFLNIYNPYFIMD